jgi:glutaredoxin-like protein DUF836
MEKADCHLCAKAFRALRRVALDRPLEIERVDIEAAPGEVRDRYMLRIPVLVAAGEELDLAGLEDREIARWLGEVTPEA